MNPKQIGHEGLDWIKMAQFRVQWRIVVNTVSLGFTRRQEFVFQLSMDHRVLCGVSFGQ